MPRPPAAHPVTIANRPSSRISRFAAVVTSLAPVAPKGCPRESDPPRVLSFSSGHLADLFRPAQLLDGEFVRGQAFHVCQDLPREGLVGFEHVDVGKLQAGAGEELRHRVRRPQQQLLFGVLPGIGVIPYERLGTYPSARAASSEAISTAAAPSVRKEELPAVTVP